MSADRLEPVDQVAGFDHRQGADHLAEHLLGPAVEFPRTEPGKVAGQLAGKGDQSDRPSAGRWNL